MSKDFSYGTIRNKIISGSSRTNVFLSLFISCSIVIVLAMAAAGICFVVFFRVGTDKNCFSKGLASKMLALIPHTKNLTFLTDGLNLTKKDFIFFGDIKPSMIFVKSQTGP